MTDLEITKLCAEAMGYKVEYITSDGQKHYRIRGVCTYAPLHDDAQALALVKKFRLEIGMGWEGKIKDFGVKVWNDHSGRWCWHWAISNDLNRAICECVAQMQAAKPSGARPRNGG